MPQAVPAPITGAVSRRAFFGSAIASGVAATQPPIFTVPAVADAALLAFGAVISDLVARRDPLYPAVTATELAAFEIAGPAPEAHTPECRAWFEALLAAKTRCGHDAAHAAYRAADDALLAVLDEVTETPATTLAGLMFKARLAHEHEIEEISASIVADLIAMGEVA